MSHTAVSLLTAVLLLAAAPAQQRRSQRGGDDDDRPRNRVEIVTRGKYRYIKSNGIPDHPHGRFPNRNNPNSISAQDYDLRVPLHPKAAKTITAAQRQPFGVALNGVLFDPGTAEYWQRDRSSGWRYEALSGKINLGLDSSNAHVQPTGAYHYHGLPDGLVKNLDGQRKMKLIGYAADGFAIYNQYGYTDPQDGKSAAKIMRSSYQLKKGTRPDGPGGRYDGTFVQDYQYVEGSGDLDQCNGRVGITPDHPEGIYHYHLTQTFPFVPRYYRGTPDDSFRRRGPPPDGREDGPPDGPPGAHPPPDGRPHHRHPPPRRR